MAKGAKLSPLGGKILVKPIEEETGLTIVIPDTVKEDAKPQRGEVIALGTGRILDNGSKLEFNVKVGDEVYFKQYAPDSVEVSEGGEETEYLIMDESDVLAVID